ncbi:MAG: zinc ribbon domain-containing protein [Candidatus Heimdallarchaeota archaeon]|nr:zinc ribbon domain-containing protein [Candidatus Heimdallarchaeota archaeon]
MMRDFRWKLAAVEKGILQPKKCPKCGKPLVKGSTVCVFCRQDSEKVQPKVEKPSKKPIECPNCKALNKHDSIVCTTCGVNFVKFRLSNPKDLKALRKARKRKKH